jgi:spore maturation protein CgeB
MKKQITNTLVLSSYNDGMNRVFEDYCTGIKAQSESYHYIDYIQSYLDDGKRAFEERVSTVIREKNIDTLFLIWWSCDLTIDPEFLRELSTRVRIVMNFFDTEYYFESVDRYYAQLADLVILPDELSRYRYEHLGIPCHTSFALFDANHYKNKQQNKDIDVSFVGNLKNADRLEYVEYLKANGISVETYGTGSKNGFASFEEMVDVFNRSKINLNLTTLTSFTNYIVPIPRINERIRQSKGRPIELALCGGFILSQHAAGIEKMFIPGEEFELFSDKKEMLEKVKHFLSESKQREKMAHQSYKKALDRYDVTAGFKIIFELLNSLPTRESLPTHFDPVFMASYGASRMYYVSRYILRGNFKLALKEFFLFFRTGNLSMKMGYHFLVKGAVFELLNKPKLYAKLLTIKNKIGIKVKY